MKYSDSDEFREALESKLKKDAERIGRSQDYINLREELAIERFMARVDPDFAILKGGAAAMFVLDKTPHTKDTDIIITEKVVNSFGLDKMSPDKRAQELGDLIADHLRLGPKGDFFRFKIENAFAITDLKPRRARARINMTVMVGKAELHFMQIDIALQHGNVPSQLIDGRDMLNFAGVQNPKIRTVTPEYLVADKVTLYLEEHGQPDAGRVKDIVHAALLIQNCSLNKESLTELLAEHAHQREVVQKLNEPIPNPPEHWNDRFDELMEQANSNMSIREAMKTIRDCIDGVREHAYELATG